MILIHESPTQENAIVVVDPNFLVQHSIKDPLDWKRVECMVTTYKPDIFVVFELIIIG